VYPILIHGKNEDLFYIKIRNTELKIIILDLFGLKTLKQGRTGGIASRSSQEKRT